MNLFVAVLQRLNELERRVAGTEFRGRVKKVDGERHAARVVIGYDPEGEEVLSPWTPIGQEAGDMKFHNMPAVGQQVSLQSASGDIELSRIVPLHWSEGKEAPSDDPDLKLMTLGDARVEWTGDYILIQVGASSIRITADDIHMAGPMVTHDDKNIGKTHLHEDAGGIGYSGVPSPHP